MFIRTPVAINPVGSKLAPAQVIGIEPVQAGLGQQRHLQCIVPGHPPAGGEPAEMELRSLAGQQWDRQHAGALTGMHAVRHRRGHADAPRGGSGWACAMVARARQVPPGSNAGKAFLRYTRRKTACMVQQGLPGACSDGVAAAGKGLMALHCSGRRQIAGRSGRWPST